MSAVERFDERLADFARRHPEPNGSHAGTSCVQQWRRLILKAAWKHGPVRYSISETVWYPADGSLRTAVESARERMKATYDVPLPMAGVQVVWTATVDANVYEDGGE